ncbi:phage tail tape measure protein [Nocardioides bruguierae]|uniref:phage tail tape measure protein n=1 Tax=Nocardioides bruguierae TaxID=2945102 RepID=UPI0020221D9B|nr:phage tail tape measure protein [Nocardioides bruguierae]MCL8026308.1 phage tail tape measure protein [Nocardioides bruguierae]
MTATSRSVVVRLDLDTAQAIRNSQQFGDAMGRAMDDTEAGARRADAAVNQLGNTAGKIGAVATGALVAAGKAAMDWESQFAGVEKTVDATSAQLVTLEDDLRGMARTMAASHQEIAATAEAAGQLGVATDDITDFTRTMVQLGETTNLTSDEAATSIAQFMNVLRSSGDDVDEIGSTIVALGNNGASTEAQIVSMAQRVAGAGATIGASEADVLALSAAMANLGIESELGGGAMQRVLLEINSAVLEGGEQAEAFAEIAGMSATQFAAAWKNDPIAAVDALIGGLGDVQASGGNVVAVLDDLGIRGTQNLQVMLRLAGAGDTLTEALDQSRSAWSENTALVDEYGKRAETTGAQAQVAWNNIRDAGIEAGDVLLPIVADIAGGVSDVAQAFSGLPDPVQNSLVGLTGIVAVVGGGAWFTSKAIGAVRDTRSALQDLGLTADRTSGSLGSVAKTGAGLVAVAGAVTMIGNALAEASGAKVDASDLNRQLEAISQGAGQDLINRVTEDLTILDSTLGKVNEPLYETVTLFGAFGNTGRDNAQDNIKQVDQALAALVESGNAEQASEIFNQILAAQTGLSAESSFTSDAINGLAGNFGSFQTALGNAGLSAVEVSRGITEAGDSADAAADPTAQYNAQIRETQQVARASAQEIRDLVDAMSEQREQALSAFDAETRYRQAMKDAAAQAKTNSAGIRGMSDDAIANRNALSDLAGAWNDQDKAVKNNVERYKDARKNFIDTAASMGVARSAAADLAAEVLDIPKSRVIKLDADARQAMADMQAAKAALDQLQSKTITIRYTASGTQALSPGFGPVPVSADGSTVPHDGGPYGDRYLYMLAPGEEVVSNRRGQADRFRPLLKAINNAADGDTVGGLRGFSLEQRGDVYSLTQQVRQLVRSLAATGDDQLKGLDRLIAQNDLAQTREDLRDAKNALIYARQEQQLDRQYAIQQKLVASAERQVEVSQQNLQALRSQASELSATVAQRLTTSDLFAGADVPWVELARPSSYDSWSAEQQQAWMDRQTEWNVANGWGGNASDPNSILRADIRNARQERRDIRQLRRRGLSGDALEYVISQGNVDDALNMSRRELAEFQRLYGRRTDAVGQAGGTAVSAVLGEELRESREVAKESRAELREANRTLARIERLTELAPDKLAKAVENGLDIKTVRGNRGRSVGNRG